MSLLFSALKPFLSCVNSQYFVVVSLNWASPFSFQKETFRRKWQKFLPKTICHCCSVVVVFWYKCSSSFDVFWCRRASEDKKYCMFRRRRVINGVDFWGGRAGIGSLCLEHQQNRCNKTVLRDFHSLYFAYDRIIRWVTNLLFTLLSRVFHWLLSPSPA